MSWQQGAAADLAAGAAARRAERAADVDALLALEADWARTAERFDHRAGLIAEAERDGFMDYLTCPACRAMVPITGPDWSDVCPRCDRCIGI